MIGSWAAIPERAWIQIVFLVALLEADIFKQDPEKAPGDVVPDGWLWARYPDGYTVWLGDGSEKTVCCAALAPSPLPLAVSRDATGRLG